MQVIKNPGCRMVGCVRRRSRSSALVRVDRDLGVYYRKSRRMIDPGDVRRLSHDGQVSVVGEWGPIVNGGAWLTVADIRVDVLFRDLGSCPAS
jgi:hypothetical protein